MKTAQRILYTALSLFNEQGESNVTSVDIAMEMDISPGNLYYHYKGKEVMVDALASLHKKEMLTLLSRSIVQKIRADDLFYYLHMVVEKLHLFKFLYRSPTDLTEKYPQSSKIMKQVTQALEGQLKALFEHLESQGDLVASPAEKTLLKELTALVLTQSAHYDQRMAAMDEEGQRYHALSLIMVSLMPRLTLSQRTLAAISQAIHSHSLANTGLLSEFESV